MEEVVLHDLICFYNIFIRGLLMNYVCAGRGIWDWQYLADMFTCSSEIYIHMCINARGFSSFPRKKVKKNMRCSNWA